MQEMLWEAGEYDQFNHNRSAYNTHQDHQPPASSSILPDRWFWLIRLRAGIQWWMSEGLRVRR